MVNELPERIQIVPISYEHDLLKLITSDKIYLILDDSVSEEYVFKFLKNCKDSCIKCHMIRTSANDLNSCLNVLVTTLNTIDYEYKMDLLVNVSAANSLFTIASYILASKYNLTVYHQLTEGLATIPTTPIVRIDGFEQHVLCGFVSRQFAYTVKDIVKKLIEFGVDGFSQYTGNDKVKARNEESRMMVRTANTLHKLEARGYLKDVSKANRKRYELTELGERYLMLCSVKQNVIESLLSY